MAKGAGNSFTSTARYSRQEIVLGKTAQENIRSRTVGIVGLGGTGCFSAVLCAQLGVKTLVIADMDVVDASNLGRQLLYAEEDVGKEKAAVAAEKLGKINAETRVRHYTAMVAPGNAGSMFGGCDVVLDCTDSYEARAAIDAFCRKNGIPWVYCAAVGTEAMARFVDPKKDGRPFTRWAAKPDCEYSCEQFGVLNTACATAAAMQVQLLLDWLCGKPEDGALHYADMATLQTATRPIRKK